MYICTQYAFFIISITNSTKGYFGDIIGQDIIGQDMFTF